MDFFPAPPPPGPAFLLVDRAPFDIEPALMERLSMAPSLAEALPPLQTLAAENTRRYEAEIVAINNFFQLPHLAFTVSNGVEQLAHLMSNYLDVYIKEYAEAVRYEIILRNAYTRTSPFSYRRFIRSRDTIYALYNRYYRYTTWYNERIHFFAPFPTEVDPFGHEVLDIQELDLMGWEFRH